MTVAGFPKIAFVNDEDNAKREAVLSQIREAFGETVLGKGIGLLEGQGWDGGMDEATCLAYREQDEKLDWNNISAEKLNECHSSLSFFDAEGMRFHLPAYLVADLKEELWVDPVFHLTHLNDYGKGKLVLLSSEQRKAVRSYLHFVKTQPNYEFSREEIEAALGTYWDANVER